jgi:hypothetical protein
MTPLCARIAFWMSVAHAPSTAFRLATDSSIHSMGGRWWPESDLTFSTHSQCLQPGLAVKAGAQRDVDCPRETQHTLQRQTNRVTADHRRSHRRRQIGPLDRQAPRLSIWKLDVYEAATLVITFVQLQRQGLAP